MYHLVNLISASKNGKVGPYLTHQYSVPCIMIYHVETIRVRFHELRKNGT